MINIPPDKFRRMGYRAVDMLADYSDRCRAHPVGRPDDIRHVSAFGTPEC